MLDISKQARESAFHLLDLAREYDRDGQCNLARDLREAAYLLRILRASFDMKKEGI